MLKNKKLLYVLIILATFVGFIIFNSFIYPVWPDNPNYSDVERVFNKMTFPADWKQIDESQNKGTAGRTCPIESESACFHKAKTYKVPVSTSADEVRRVLSMSGCPAVAETDNTDSGDKGKVYRLDCSVDGLSIGSDFDTNKMEVYVSVSTH